MRIKIPPQFCQAHNPYKYNAECTPCTEIVYPPADLHFDTTSLDTPGTSDCEKLRIKEQLLVLTKSQNITFSVIKLYSVPREAQNIWLVILPVWI